MGIHPDFEILAWRVTLTSAAIWADPMPFSSATVGLSIAKKER
jgi:hypothetical protein